MKKLLTLLGILCVCVLVLSGCGNKADNIEGSWVPKVKSDKLAITSIDFVKQNDFSYKGTVNYTDGTKTVSTFAYSKEYKALEEDMADVRKKDKEQNIVGRWLIQFNDNYTEAKVDDSGKPEYMLVKK